MARKKSEDLVDIEGELMAETERAYKINDGKKREWVPKAHVEFDNDNTFTMPYWLAEEKGFL